MAKDKTKGDAETKDTEEPVTDESGSAGNGGQSASEPQALPASKPVDPSGAEARLISRVFPKVRAICGDAEADALVNMLAQLIDLRERVEKVEARVGTETFSG